MKNKWIIPVLLWLLLPVWAAAQQYNMTNGTVTTCSGYFYDSGGVDPNGAPNPAFGYGNNENYTFTICPSTGNVLTVNFISFDLAAGDMLAVYNGNSTSAPLIGVYDQTNILSGIVFSSSNTNPTGCLTFVFTSDAADTALGWVAEITCTLPCQSFSIQFDSLSPDTNSQGFVDVCPGDTAYFSVEGLYFNNDLNYHQSDTTTQFYWSFGDSAAFDTGRVVLWPYDSIGAFLVQVNAVDSHGCSSQFNLNLFVRVATDPDFSPSGVLNDTICFGDTNTIFYGANSVAWTNADTTNAAPTTYLPDGSGTSPGVYNNTLTFTRFGTGDTVANINQILSVWVNMEHSFLGDLTIRITCPNNSMVTLKQFPGGGGRWLGEACDNNNTPTPGIGYLYEWTPSGNTYADMVSVAGACTPCLTVQNPCNIFQTGTTLPSGTYNSFQAMNGLVGCPLNGTWTLTIIDQWAIDNGYLFTWGINFDSTLYPPTVITYDPGIDSIWVDLDPAAIVTSASSDQFTVVPQYDDTTLCYMVNVMDGFGCQHDTTVCFYVEDRCASGCYIPTQPTFTVTKVGCPGGSDGSVIAFPDTSVVIPPFTYVWSDQNGNVLQTTGPVSGPDTLSGLVQGTYYLDITDSNGCISSSQVFVGTVPAMQLNVSSVTQTSCAGNFCDANATAVVFFGTAPYSYQWSSPDTAQTAYLLCSGPNWVEVTDDRGCVDTVFFNVTQPDSIDAFAMGSTLICIGDSTPVSASGAGGTPPYNFTWMGGLSVGPVWTVAPTVTTSYVVSVSDANNCPPDTAWVTVYVRPPLSITFVEPDTLCPGDLVTLTAAGHGGDSNYTFVWEGTLGTGPMVTTTVTTPQFYSVTLTDGCGTPQAVDSVWVQVGGYPPIKVETNPDDTICIGEPQTLLAVATGGDGHYTYEWDNGLGFGQLKAVAPTVPTIYRVTVTDDCFSLPGTDSIFVDVGNFSDFNLIVDSNKKCDPATFYFGFDTLNPHFIYEMNIGSGFETVDPYKAIKRVITADGCHDIRVRLTTELGCSTTKSYPCFVEVWPTPVADFDFSPHGTDQLQPFVDFWDESIGDITSWFWTADGMFLSDKEKFTYAFPDTGDYLIQLIVSNEYTCSDTSRVNMPLDFTTTYFVPSAFTPNGDNINDVFRMEGEGIRAEGFDMKIYDRWGELIYHTTDRDASWDGTFNGMPAQSGQYVYIIRFKLHTGLNRILNGQVTLIR